MGSLPPELSLDFRPTTYVPKTVTDFLKEVSLIRNVSNKVSKLDSFVNALQDEIRKIDAFKRELPLCMLLLNDAIFFLKSEATQCGAANNPPVLEEFMPLKKSADGDDKNDDDQHSLSIKIEKDSNKDKKNWMSSVQLWNSNDNPSSTVTDSMLETTKQNLTLEPEVVKKVTHQYTNGDAFQSCKSRNAARSFMPFKNYSGLSRKEDSTNKGEELSIPGLSLLTPGIKNLREECCSSGARVSCSRVVSSSAATNSQSNVRNGPQPPHQQTSRKQRRCWSPELHRRFVNALQQLGGSQAATPKQIRELMQVDGLTNDEVKSHLQKYRLHTRRVPSGTAATPASQSVVVLGGSLWVSQGQDQYGDDSKGNNSSSSPEGPLQLAGNTGGTSTTGGDSMEDDDDSKSEGYSWKSHIQGSGKVDV